MIKLQELELQEISLEEIISYSKILGSPVVTITDELTAGQFNYVVAYADFLKLFYMIVKGTRKVAFLGATFVALKICKNMGVKCQTIHQHMFRTKNATKTNLTQKQHMESYTIKAYDTNGDKTQPFIDTNVPKVECNMLSKIEYEDLKYNVVPRKSKNGKVNPREIIKLREQYLSTEL